MRMSSRGGHAIRAMMNLALNTQDKPITLAELAQENFISISYLEQLFAKLREGGLVSGVRGPGGGYVLARPAKEITVGDIIAAVDEHGPKAANPQSPNHVDIIWSELSHRFYNFLDDITLEDSIARTQGAGNPAINAKH